MSARFRACHRRLDSAGRATIAGRRCIAPRRIRRRCRAWRFRIVLRSMILPSVGGSRSAGASAHRGGFEMKTWMTMKAAALGLALACLAAAAGAATYPTMAPPGDYLMADRAAEIALARTAAPPSVSDAAAVMVLERKGYVLVAPGGDGFVCLVQRAWFSGLADDGFWNPKLRAPICYNRQAARSVLPAFLKRTAWAMAGASQAEIRQRIRAAMAAGRYPPAEAGAITYMMSKEGYLGDGPHGPWRPHLT